MRARVNSIEKHPLENRIQKHSLRRITPPIAVFNEVNVLTGPSRPTELTNAWVADPADLTPELVLEWGDPVEVSRVIVEFDPDWDHPMESVLMTHPEEVAPFMVKDFEVLTGDGETLAEVKNHHGARYVLELDQIKTIQTLTLKIYATHGAPAAVFRLRVE